MALLPKRLAEIVEDFQYCEGQEKLEYLLQFAENLTPVPEELRNQHDRVEQVHECLTPVFVFIENNGGQLAFHFDIPPESPTVRGYAGVLQQGLNGATPATIAQIPDQFYLEMGLQHVLSGQRLHGMGAILAYIKDLARQQEVRNEATAGQDSKSIA